jgi:hypothetical protein
LVYDRRNVVVDVFFDKLRMSHTIDFRKRLDVDAPTISVSDLLLEKMQIVKLTEKDAKDTVIVFTEHSVNEDDNENVDSRYIANLLADDWGFYYTVTTNLKRIRDEFAPKYLLSSQSLEDVRTKNKWSSSQNRKQT